jgi:peptidoglycan hydrolase-like amidase
MLLSRLLISIARISAKYCQPAGFLSVATGLVLVPIIISFCQDSAKAARKASAASVASVQLPADLKPYPMMLHPMRIGIAQKVSSARFACWDTGAVFIDETPIFQLRPHLVYLLTPGRLTEYATGQSIALPLDKRARIAARDYRIWANDKWYRGTLEVITFNNKVTMINLLDLENYLMGVVPSEMPANWELEALKAQAVAARSYAWAHRLGNGSKWNSDGFDLVPDVRDQAYKGLAVEAAKSSAAVLQTQGLVLKDSGRVKAGFYRAWVGDAFENLNIRRKAVASGTLERLTGVSQIVGMSVKQWDVNQNAVGLQVMGAKNSRDVSGVALSKYLGFETAGILDVAKDGNNWLFTYRGPGNGARGLSQHGADMLAKRGWNFEQILRQYYQDQDGKLRLDYIDAYPVTARRVYKKHSLAHDEDDKNDSETTEVTAN